MPSTYTLNNGIELIATGEQSGTWGDTTNTNLSLVDTALDGQVTVTLPSAGSSGSPNTLAISDGAASDGRNRMVIFNDGGDLGATAYVQLTPNDAEKIIYVRNDLAGSRSIILFQGTYNASNDYELPAGTTAVIYFDGAGSGAVAANVFNNAYFDSLRLGSVSVDKILDEDNMASDDASALATQQSIKAYVDSQVTAQDLDFGGDSGTGAVDLDSQTFTIAGTANEIETSASNQTLTIGLPDDVTIAGDLTVDTNTLYVDSANNQVGIGTTSPAARLTIAEDLSGPLDATAFRLNASSANDSNTLFGGPVSSGNYSFFQSYKEGTSAGVRVLALNPSGGNVGIGTSSPTQKLQVSGGSFLQQQSGATNNTAPTAVTVSNLTTGAHAAGLGASLLFTHINSGGGYNGPKISSVSNADPFTSNLVFYSHNYSHSEAMRIDSNGNVGIGTSAPVNNSNRTTLGLQGAWGGQLDIMVGSTVHAQFGTDNFSSGQSARIQSQDGIVFKTNGSNERMRIDSSGNVGIGTTSPASILHANGTDAEIRLQSSSQTSNLGKLRIDPANNKVVLESTSTHALAFNTNASEAMRIDSSGNLLVGTTSNPSSRKLRVYGIAEIDGAGVGLLNFKSSGTDIGAVGQGNYVVSGGPSGGFGMQSAAELVFGTNGTTERMRIDSSGNVGIGTSSPTQKLQVRNSATTITSSYISVVSGVDGNAGITFGDVTTDLVGGVLYNNNENALRFFKNGFTEAARIDSSGNLGIGTTSPAAKLDITGSDPGVQMAVRGWDMLSVGSPFALEFGGVNASEWTTLKFFTSGLERMRIDQDGFVGIGITPSDWRTQFDDNALDVGNHSAIYDQWGGATFIANNFYRENNNAFIYKTSNDASFLQMDGGNITFGNAPNGTAGATATFSERMRINGSGNIGINESSPDTKLHVSNNLSATPIATIENTASHEATIRFKSAHSAASDFRVGASISASNNFEIYSVDASTPRLTIDSSGNVGINRTSQDGVLLDAEASSAGNIYGLRIRNRGQSAGSAVSAIWSLNRDGSDVNFPAASIKAIKEQNWTTAPSTIDGAMIFETISNETSSEKMRISSDGDLYVGCTSVPSSSVSGFSVQDNAGKCYLLQSTFTTGNNIMTAYINPNGTVGGVYVSGSSTTYATSSDYRLKENVVEITGATDRLKQLKPSRFNFIADPNVTVDGFLAHEVQSVVPEAITGTHNEVDDDGNPVYQGIDQSKLVPLLVATIKELEARITALENA